jgi:hypothetical protein
VRLVECDLTGERVATRAKKILLQSNPLSAELRTPDDRAHTGTPPDSLKESLT